MAKTKATTLVKGNKYKKADFGIRFPRTFFGAIDINGERYLFVNIGGKFNNKLQNGDILHEPRKTSEVVKQDETPTKTHRVFLRDLTKNQTDFEYLGEVDIIKPVANDPKRHLLVIK